MNTPSKEELSQPELMPWIEPEVHELHIRETSMQPLTGSDGNSNINFPDCTHS